MKKPKRYPIMRSAKQAMYMRELLMSDIYRISNKSGFIEMQKKLDRLAMLNAFIEARTISKDDFKQIHVRYEFLHFRLMQSRAYAIEVISKEFELSIRSVKYLLKQSL